MKRLLVLLVALLLLGGAAGPTYAATVQPLPVGTRADYQLGGPRSVPDDVGIVVRDRRAPAAGRYDVCYVNGFQTQPGEHLAADKATNDG